jgi:hypothetical protein
VWSVAYCALQTCGVFEKPEPKWLAYKVLVDFIRSTLILQLKSAVSELSKRRSDWRRDVH